MPHIKELSGRTGKTVESVTRVKGDTIVIVISGERFKVGLDTYLNHYFYQGKELTSKEYKTFLEEVKNEKDYKYLSKLLLKGTVSEKEAFFKLLKRKVEPHQASLLLKKAKDAGLIDDDSVLTNLVDDYLYRGLGNRGIKEKLKLEHNFENDKLTEIDLPTEQERVEKLFTNVLKKYQNENYEMKKRKITDFFLRHGYSESSIKGLVESIPYDEKKERTLLKEELRRYLSKKGHPKERKEYYKLTDYFLRKGYKLTMIREEINDEQED